MIVPPCPLFNFVCFAFLSATTALSLIGGFTYLQIWTESYDRVLEFVKRSNAVSPTVALETAAVLQVLV